MKYKTNELHEEIRQYRGNRDAQMVTQRMEDYHVDLEDTAIKEKYILLEVLEISGGKIGLLKCRILMRKSCF